MYFDKFYAICGQDFENRQNGSRLSAIWSLSLKNYILKCPIFLGNFIALIFETCS